MSYPRYQHSRRPAFNLNGEDTIYPYGKYTGKTLKNILSEDTDYFLWLKDNCSIQGIADIINEMLITYVDFIQTTLDEKSDKLKAVKTLPSHEIMEIDIPFDRNLHVYHNESGEELFAFYKYNTVDLIYNVIFAKGNYKKYQWQDTQYALPTNGPSDSGKRVKGKTVHLTVETREPYIDKRGNRMVQNLLVKSFNII